VSLFRRKRRVRVQQLDGPTIEGIQLGRRPIGGHYVLLVAKIVEADRNVTLDASAVEIPKERVVFLEVLSK
jgi:hypothetical protein